ncbi:hypothetical protein AB0I28_24640 [Phytomonospora sp. NPDC050363]|uniref:hypothetical protein n=1 Tax=Phytomonospora sp. NPDC050363 TaxID=3155642 RepID=UPI00340AE7D0
MAGDRHRSFVTASHRRAEGSHNTISANSDKGANSSQIWKIRGESTESGTVPGTVPSEPISWATHTATTPPGCPVRSISHGPAKLSTTRISAAALNASAMRPAPTRVRASPTAPTIGTTRRRQARAAEVTVHGAPAAAGRFTTNHLYHSHPR